MTQKDQAKAELRQLSKMSTGGVMRGSVSYVSRKVGMGWNAAFDLLDELAKEGFITPPDNSGARRLITQEETST